MGRTISRQFGWVETLVLRFLKQMDLFTIAPELELKFKEKKIIFKECELPISTNGKKVHYGQLEYFYKCKQGNNLSTVSPKGKNYWFNYIKLHPNKVCPTLASAINDKLFHYEIPEQLNLEQWCILGSFPLDYDFMENGVAKNDGRYLIGMSVPPIMTAQIATKIREQWLSKL